MFDFTKASEELLEMVIEDPSIVDKFNNTSAKDLGLFESKGKVSGFVQKEKIEAELNEIIDYFDFIKIDCIEKARGALCLALRSRKLSQSINDQKKEICKAQADFIKEMAKQAKAYTDSLEQIEKTITQHLDDWLTDNLHDSFPNGLSTLQVEQGALYRKNVWKFAVIDPKLVPQEFINIDEKEVKRQISAGVRDIPGLLIFEEMEVSLRINNN